MSSPSTASVRRPVHFGLKLGLAVGALFVLHVAVANYQSEADNFAPYRGNELILHPERTGIGGIESVSFNNADGSHIAGWYTASRNRAAIILVHGTNADRTTLLPEMRLLANAGFGVLAIDLPGQGASEGQVHWNLGERQALSAAVDWVSARADVDPQRIGGFGFSMGGYVLVQVAASDPRLHALTLAATPTGILDLARWEHRKWGILSQVPAEFALRESGMPLNEMLPEHLISRIAPRPLLIFGGDADPTVPESMTRALYAAAREPKTLWIIEGAHHGDYAATIDGEYATHLIHFFEQSLSG